MELSKIIITIALTFTITMAMADQSPLPSTRVSRFLQSTNSRAASGCKNQEWICGSACCNNKCVTLETDNNNCGACRNKCKYTEVCCRGECVNVSFDKRHCGGCNHRCLPKYYCVYGMCNYAWFRLRILLRFVIYIRIHNKKKVNKGYFDFYISIYKVYYFSFI